MQQYGRNIWSHQRANEIFPPKIRKFEFIDFPSYQYRVFGESAEGAAKMGRQ